MKLGNRTKYASFLILFDHYKLPKFYISENGGLSGNKREISSSVKRFDLETLNNTKLKRSTYQISHDNSIKYFWLSFGAKDEL